MNTYILTAIGFLARRKQASRGSLYPIHDRRRASFQPRQKFKYGEYTYPALICIIISGLLIGCSGQDGKMKNTEEFVKKTQQTKEQNVEPLPQFVIPTLPKSPANTSRNPFSPEIENQQLKPDTSHTPGPLESFSLSQLHYVGILSQTNQTWGLISTPTGAIYNISMGQYIGQNYGKVVQITPQKITVQETVSNGLGGWVIRTKELPIFSGGQQGSQP